MKGADVFLDYQPKKNVVNRMTMIKIHGRQNPNFIFACANPDPEIKPEIINEVRSDVNNCDWKIRLS